MKKIYSASGQSSLEFALVLPLILLIIIVFIDLGRIIYFHSALNNAIREGARYATVNQFTNSTQRDTAIHEKVVTYAVALPIQPADISVWCNQDPTDTDNPCEYFVTVSAEIEIESITAFTSWVLGDDSIFNITAESTMQMTPWGAYEN